MIYFTSDLHFGHANIIKFCNRPFSSVKEMNMQLVINYNSVVSNKDTTYILGDFAMRMPKAEVESILNSLNGNKVLIIGNHDDSSVINAKGWSSVHTVYELRDKDIHIVLSHFPMRSWNKSHYGSYHLYGHHHGGIEDYGFSFDVGVDAQNYFPISLDKVIDKMSTKTIKKY
jgi:calcineurin-like phosphoesterase family protein